MNSVFLNFSLENVYKTNIGPDDEGLNLLLSRVFDALNYVSASSELMWAADFGTNLYKEKNRLRVSSNVTFRVSAERNLDIQAARLTSEIYSLLDVAFAKHGLVFSTQLLTDIDDRRQHMLPFNMGSAYEMFRRLNKYPYKSFQFSNAMSLSNLYDFCTTSDLQLCRSVTISPIYNWPDHLERIYADFDANFESFEKNPLKDLDGHTADSAARYRGSVRLLFDRSDVPELVRRGIFSSIVGGTNYISHEVAQSDYEELEERVLNVEPATFFENLEHSGELSDAAIFLHDCYKSTDLANLINFPTRTYPGIEYNPFPNLTEGIEMMPEDGCVIGHARKLGNASPFEIRQRQQDRFRHSYVIGKTGTGKSSFLLNSILHDIEGGSCVVVVDPHGDLCDKVAERVPERRQADIIQFDVSNHESPPCFNPLKVFASECVVSGRDEKYQQTFVINQLNEFFLKYYGNEIFGPRIQDYFINSCRTVMQLNPNATIIDAAKLMLDPKFRKEILGPGFEKLNELDDEDVKWFWNVQFKGTGGREHEEMIPYFASKFTPFLADRVLNSIFGAGKNADIPGIDVAEALENNKIILLKLSKGVLGGLGMSMIGTSLVSRIVNFSISKGAVKQEERQPVFLYVDEFQNFISDFVLDALSEARKYGLGLTLAHQYLAQLDNVGSFGGKGMKQAIFGNVGSLYSFRIGVDDAETIAKSMAYPNLGDYLMKLNNFFFYGSVLDGGEPRGPLLMKGVHAEETWPKVRGG